MLKRRLILFFVVGEPQIWCPVDGSIKEINFQEELDLQRTKITLQFESRQSFFIVFGSAAKACGLYHNNSFEQFHKIKGSWQVAFEPEWGGQSQRISCV